MAWTLVFCLLAGAAFAEPKTESGHLREFAEGLFSQGEYFRAATEYMRMLSYHPAPPEADEIKFKIALCSYKAQRHGESAHQFARLAVLTSSTELKDRCQLMAAASRYQEQAYGDAFAICDQALVNSPESRHRDRLSYLKGLSLLHLTRWEEAREVFGTVPAASTLAGSATDLGALAARATHLPHRRPWVTGVLSALVPGLGQITCGYYWDGLSALALSGASLAIAVAGIQKDNNTLKATGFSLFGLWYTASIYGGVNAASRYNRQAAVKLLAEADATSTLSLD